MDIDSACSSDLWGLLKIYHAPVLKARRSSITTEMNIFFLVITAFMSENNARYSIIHLYYAERVFLTAEPEKLLIAKPA